MGMIEIKALGKYLCTGPLQKIQFFSSTPEDEVTTRGNLTTDLVMVTLASTTLASEHFPLTLSINFTVTSIVKTIMGQRYGFTYIKILGSLQMLFSWLSSDAFFLA